MIGSNPIFSTDIRNTADNQCFNELNGVYSAKTQPQKKERSNNLAFSTKNHQITTDKLFDGFKNPISDKLPPRNRTLSSMEIPDLPYTIPRLFKGKKIESVPKGSTRAKEEALQGWYVDFFFTTHRLVRWKGSGRLRTLTG